ncbi:cysteinyl leukotriene receptor 1-like [Convolutriloba macropyga]
MSKLISMDGSENNSNSSNDTNDYDDQIRSMLWQEYPNSFSIPMGFLHLLAFFGSFLGNLLILSVKIFSKRGRATRKSSFLLLNLVVSDLLTSLFCILPATVQVFFHGYWMFGEWLCSVYGLLMYTGVTCSYVFMTLLGKFHS